MLGDVYGRQALNLLVKIQVSSTKMIYRSRLWVALMLPKVNL